MARLPRLAVAHQAHHLIQRGHDRQEIVRDHDDCRAYLHALREASRSAQVAIHAYVLMPNHVHLLATPQTASGLGQMMQSLGRRYVARFNQRYARSGTLWEGRYRAAPVQADLYVLACMRFIELNPVRQGLVRVPQQHPWSSCAHHTGTGPRDALVTEHPLYWQLGNTPFEREAAYQRWLAQGCSRDEGQILTQSVLKGWALGDAGYLSQLATHTTRPLTPRAKGRPKKGPSVHEP